MSLAIKLSLGALVLSSFPAALFLFPVTTLNAVASVGYYQLSRDIPYAEGARHTLDIYQPAGLKTPAPIVVFFYGGSWDQGNKEIYRFLGAALAAKGFIVIVPDYRIYPEVRFPGFLEDAAMAVGWAKSHAASLGADPDKMVLMGHSAGAHIAAMLTFDPQWLEAAGLDPARDIKGMIGLAGPYDFLPLHSDRLKEIFGPPEGLAATQPINFVTASAPPVFLGVPPGDTVVKPKNTVNLAAQIVAQGGPQPVVKFYPHASHLTLIGAFALPLRWLAPVLLDTAQFIRDVTGSTDAVPPSGRLATEPV